MARSPEEKVNGKGNRKDSRKNALEALYKACKKDSKELAESLSQKTDKELRSKKLYLYYRQKGKCMYSGNEIRIESLFTNDYDIDHIYPQSVVKDDSIENNLVLVERNYNNRKSDTYPIFEDWRNHNKVFWKILKDEGFINEEKYKRLTRKEGFTDNELADFVNRQLVETRQATKVIAELLKKSFDGKCEIVYAKASNVSEFRHIFSRRYDKEQGKSEIVSPELIKCRVVNDFHHAHDAYLNIVVGNVYNVKFTKSPLNYVKEYRKQHLQNLVGKDINNKKEKDANSEEKYHMNKIFFFDVIRNDEVAWKRGKNNSIAIVRAVLKKNTPIVTRMNYEEKGKLSDLTIWNAEKAKKGTGYDQIKTSNNKLQVSRYGGYSTYAVAYFFLVEHTKKKERIRTIEAMPIYKKDKLNTKEKIETWCADKETGLGLIDPKVCFMKIKKNSLLRINGFDYYLTGKSGNSGQF